MLSIFLFFNVHIQGSTPLHIASSRGYAETVKFLLSLGADMDMEDTEVIFICIDYLFSKYTYLTSVDEMTSMKINTKI